MVYIRFEYGLDDLISETIGPFEYIQATYGRICASPDSSIELAYFYEDFWWTPDGKHYSDFMIFTA